MRRSNAWVAPNNVYQLRLNVPPKPAPMATKLGWWERFLRWLNPPKRANVAKRRIDRARRGL